MSERTGTRWKGEEAKAYEVAKHGPDGAEFLDSALYGALTPDQVTGARAIDHGAGTGPWTEYLLKQGAKVVVSYDLNPAMVVEGVEKRFTSIDDIPYETHGVAGASGRARIMVADATHIPLRTHKDKDGYFNLGLSINVGCNLPGDIETKNGTLNVFEAHFKEAHRVTEPGGHLLVTAPNSLTHVFTNGSIDPTTIQQQIDEQWEKSADTSKDAAKGILRGFTDVLRATFTLDASGKPVLITPDTANRVKSGSPILRKIPGLVVDNVFHTAEEYRNAALAAGWEIEEDLEQSFDTPADRDAYNATHTPSEALGSEYVGHAPFLVLKLRKSTASGT